jgi:hypothetical protein
MRSVEGTARSGQRAAAEVIGTLRREYLRRTFGSDRVQ